MPAMLNAITSESWPPQIGTRRTRVAAFDEHSVEYAKCGRNKLSKCMKCSGYFDAKWIRHTFCIMCERRIREESIENKCLFIGCKLSEEAFCPHFRRCFVCDSPHSCEKCRLYRGDGESAIELVSVLQPKFLLLDFDRVRQKLLYRCVRFGKTLKCLLIFLIPLIRHFARQSREPLLCRKISQNRNILDINTPLIQI